MKIFFDVDGVLIDGWHAQAALRKPWDATMAADLGIDRDAFQHMFFNAIDGRPTSRMFDCLIGQCDLKDALAEVLPKVGCAGSADDFMRYWFEKDSNVNSEVFRLVQEIRKRGGAQLFVATGQEHHRARYLWNELSFSAHFDRFFYTAQIGYVKTDPRFFEAINCLQGIAPDERPLLFDDKPEVVDCARRAGWDAAIFAAPDDIRKHPRLQQFWREARR